MDRLRLSHLDNEEVCDIREPYEWVRPTATMAFDSDRDVMYLFGGLFKAKESSSSEITRRGATSKIYKYSISSRKIEVVVPESDSVLPKPRFSAALTFVPNTRRPSHPGYLYLFGGNDGHQACLRDFYVFDLGSKRWRPIESDVNSGPPLREAFSMNYWKQKVSPKSDVPPRFFLVVYGGSSGKAFAHYKSKEVYLFDLGSCSFPLLQQYNHISLTRPFKNI